MLEILFQDSHLVIINKPHGLLVHPSSIAIEAEHSTMQLLRDQINQRVTPVHRIDRKTSGALIFSLHRESHLALQRLFTSHELQKEYWAIVRGYAEASATIDYALKKENGKLQEAITHYRLLEKVEIPLPFGKHPTSRYSLLSVEPVTGRMHQIRRHLAHIRHPVIGDRTHGCNKQNKLFKEKWGMITMLLHARRLQFIHPFTGERILVLAPLHQEFNRMVSVLGFGIAEG